MLSVISLYSDAPAVEHTRGHITCKLQNNLHQSLARKRTSRSAVAPAEDHHTLSAPHMPGTRGPSGTTSRTALASNLWGPALIRCSQNLVLAGVGRSAEWNAAVAPTHVSLRGATCGPSGGATLAEHTQHAQHSQCVCGMHRLQCYGQTVLLDCGTRHAEPAIREPHCGAADSCRRRP